MKRSEAYHILGKMWEDATPEQAEALSIAQDDIEFVDLMPNDMVAVVRCEKCEHCVWYTESNEILGTCETKYWCTHGPGRPVKVSSDHFCGYGERSDDNGTT